MAHHLPRTVPERLKELAVAFPHQSKGLGTSARRATAECQSADTGQDALSPSRHTSVRLCVRSRHCEGLADFAKEPSEPRIPFPPAAPEQTKIKARESNRRDEYLDVEYAHINVGEGAGNQGNQIGPRNQEWQKTKIWHENPVELIHAVQAQMIVLQAG